MAGRRSGTDDTNDARNAADPSAQVADQPVETDNEAMGERLCACGCGEPCARNSIYAGGTESQRAPHRVAASRARKTAEQAATKDSEERRRCLVKMGLADAALPELVKRATQLQAQLKAALDEVVIRAEDLDEVGIQRQIRAQNAELTVRLAEADSRSAGLQNELDRGRTAVTRCEEDLRQAHAECDRYAELLVAAETELNAARRDAAEQDESRQRAEQRLEHAEHEVRQLKDLLRAQSDAAHAWQSRAAALQAAADDGADQAGVESATQPR